MHRRAEFMVCVLVCLCTLMSVSAAQTTEFRISEFRTTMDVAEDGSAAVMERWDATFGEPARGRDFHGFRRFLPIQAPGPRGSRSRLYIEVAKVTDEQGLPLKYNVRTARGQLEVRVPLEVRPGATRTIEVSYIVRNLVRYYADHDEIFWELTGGDLPVTVERASAMVMLPEKAAGGLRGQAFLTGAAASELTPQVRGATVQFQSWRALPPRSGFVVDIFVPKGIFQQRSWATRAGWFVAANPIILLPVAVLLAMWAVKSIKGRGPTVVATEYEPPPGLTPAEAGMLVDDRFDPRDVTATLVDLAVRGYLRIEEDRDAPPGHGDYILRVLKHHVEWGGLALHEQTMMFNVFYGGQWTKLSSLRLRFAVAVPAMESAVLNALLDKGMYRVAPRAVHVFRTAALALLAGLLMLGQTAGIFSVFQSGSLAAVAFFSSAIIVYLFGTRVSPKSLKGAQTAAEIEGFREFLNRVDADRLQQLSPDKFDKYLPYAMALGVEHHWTQAFAGIAKQTPDWYQIAGGKGYDVRLWARGLDDMAQQARDVLLASPRARFFTRSAGPVPSRKASATGKP